jgi:membrane protein YdbS with pleckstrin-like domain
MSGVNGGEQVVWVVIKAATPEVWGKYVTSLGLYEFWRRADRCTVTNRQVLRRQGLLSRTERVIPLDRIQDVSVKVGPLTGKVTISSAGAVAGVNIKVGPLWRGQAQKLGEVIQEQMQARR